MKFSPNIEPPRRLLSAAQPTRAFSLRILNTSIKTNKQQSTDQRVKKTNDLFLHHYERGLARKDKLRKTGRIEKFRWQFNFLLFFKSYKGLKWVTRFLDWQWFIFLRWVDIQSRMPSFISDEDCSWPPIREHEGNIVFDIHTSPPHRGWMII